MRNETFVVTPKRQDWRKLLPGILISAIAVLLIFYFVDFQRLFGALQLADYRFVALFFAISVGWLAVRALVWRTLLQEQAALSQVFLTLNEGYLLNNILPFRLGEVGRAFILSKKAELGFLQVFSTIIIERGLDVALAAGLLFATLPFVVKASWASQAAIIMGSLVIIGLGILYLLARNQSWATQQYDRWSARIPILRRLIGPQHLSAFFTGLAALTDGRRFLKVILLMLLNWGVALAQFYILLRGFFPDAQLLWAAFTLAVMALGVAAPSSARRGGRAGSLRHRRPLGLRSRSICHAGSRVDRPSEQLPDHRLDRRLCAVPAMGNRSPVYTGMCARFHPTPYRKARIALCAS